MPALIWEKGLDMSDQVKGEGLSSQDRSVHCVSVADRTCFVFDMPEAAIGRDFPFTDSLPQFVGCALWFSCCSDRQPCLLPDEAFDVVKLEFRKAVQGLVHADGGP